VRLSRILSFVSFCSLLWGAPLAARSWGDLDDGEHEIYGREREEKLPIRLFFVQKEEWENHHAFHILFLWGNKDYPRYKSSRIFPFYYQLESKVDNRYLLLTPLYYREQDLAARDQSAAWLYYWGERGDSGKKYSGLFPLYYYSTYKGDSPFMLTPLFWYSWHSPSAGGATYSVGIPIIPLMLWDSSPSEWDLIFFYLMRHRSRPASTLSHILPLYYYHAEGEAAFFISPLYYANTRQDSSAHSLLWLIYWGSDHIEQSGYHGVFPFYYYAHSPNDTTLVSPLYWNFEGEKSHFKLFIPFYMSYQKGDYSLQVNAAGLSFSEERLSSLPVGVQIRGEKISIDTDAGWFYNLLRISSRTTIHHEAEAPPETKPATKATAKTDNKVTPPAAPQVTAKRARNRDDSDSFFGTYALLGIFAYERADHYRHFRLLPLSWLSWDVNNDTGVQTLLPFYVHYKDEAVRYFVVGAVIPVYGKQQKFHKDCTSEISTFLVIVYWDEFDCETKTAEKTVLWPIVNHYASPERGGYRIFPLFWKKWWLEGEREKQMHFSPLHYTRIEGENFSTLSWLFYNSRDGNESTFGIWALFHRSRAHDGSAQATYFIPVYYSSQEYKNTVGTARRDSLFTFAGVFWRFHETQNSEDEFTMHISPLYIYFREKKRSQLFSWLYYDTHSSSHRTVGAPFLFHRRSDTNGNYSNFYLIPFYFSRQKYEVQTAAPATKAFADETVFWLFPLYYGERSPGYAMDNFAFVAGRKTNTPADSFSWNALLYTIWYERQQKSTHFRLGYSLLFNVSDTEHAFSWHFALLTGYKYQRDGSFLRNHLLPLWWHSRNGTDTNLYLPFLLSMFTNHDNGNRLFRAVLLGILYYHNSDAAAYDQTEHLLLGAGYYHTKNFEIDPTTQRERRFDSYGSLWGALWHYESEENYKRFSILTFIYARSERDGEVKHKFFGISF
jgi:hypothetical protein